jgi:hypothetical protein
MIGQRPVTIMDVARDHAALTRHCGCSICWAAREIERRDRKQREAQEAKALSERLMKEWP